MRTTLLSFVIIGVVCAPMAAETRAQQASKPFAPQRELAWRKTDTSLALLNGNKVVWQHVHDKSIGKPYMRIGMIDGTELTRPCPFPKDYLKTDHPWHRALWWSWKWIDDVNYWENNQQGSEPVDVSTKLNKDGSARIELVIAYHPPNEAPVLKERRIIRVSKPDTAGTYLIDWQATFMPASKDVIFKQNSYGGLALRMAAEFSGDQTHTGPAWKFLKSDGEAIGTTHSARWMAYQGSAQNNQPATLAIFAHPDNPRFPAWWQTREHYPYLNPSFTCKEDYTLRSGETLTLRYGVLVQHGQVESPEIERAFKAFDASGK
ncbi:MAG: PmoA family protein [Pirellulaceae bacterium]|jgi:hypothetical protein|nr:PmoA family protein [Pirellulaceae bacterium]